jgi:hypothetical protein
MPLRLSATRFSFIVIAAGLLAGCASPHTSASLPPTSSLALHHSTNRMHDRRAASECPSTSRAAQTYLVSGNTVPDRCAMLTALDAGQAVVFANVSVARAQALMAVAEGAPASVVPAVQDDAGQPPDGTVRYVIVSRAANGRIFLYDSLGVPIDVALAHAHADAENAQAAGRLGNAWFQVLAGATEVAGKKQTFSKVLEKGNLFGSAKCPNSISRNTRSVTYYHNVYRLISSNKNDDFYLGDAWAVRTSGSDIASAVSVAPEYNDELGWICQGLRINTGFVNETLYLDQPLPTGTKGSVNAQLYEWAPETTPKKYVYRMNLGADTKFKDKGLPETGLSARYDITWEVNEFNVAPKINGFVATTGTWNTNYWGSIGSNTPNFYEPATGPFQDTSSFLQGFTTKIPVPKAPAIYQDLYFPLTAQFDQEVGLGCRRPSSVVSQSFTSCYATHAFRLDGTAKPLVTDPVLAFQAAPGKPYEYNLTNVCVEQKDEEENPETDLRLISQQFAPVQDIPVQFSDSGGALPNPDFISVVPQLDPVTKVVTLRLFAGKKAKLNDKKVFDVETNPKHVSPSTRYNPVRFTVVIRAMCPEDLAGTRG